MKKVQKSKIKILSLVQDHQDNPGVNLCDYSLFPQEDITEPLLFREGNAKRNQTFLSNLALCIRKNMVAFTASSPLPTVAPTVFLTRYYFTYTLARVPEILASKSRIWIAPFQEARLSCSRFSVYIFRQHSPEGMKCRIRKL